MQSGGQKISAVKAISFQKTIGVFAIQIFCRPHSIGINLLGLLPLGSFKRKNNKHVKLTGFKTIYNTF